MAMVFCTRSSGTLTHQNQREIYSVTFHARWIIRRCWLSPTGWENLRLQCHIVKNTLLQTTFSVTLLTGIQFSSFVILIICYLGLFRFRVFTELLKPEKPDPATSFKGLDYIDVPSSAKKEYKMQFYAHREGSFSNKVKSYICCENSLKEKRFC